MRALHSVHTTPRRRLVARTFSDGDMHSRQARPLTSADNMSQRLMQVSIASLRSLPSRSTPSSNGEMKSNLRFVADMRVVVEMVADVEAPAEVLGSRESDTVSTNLHTNCCCLFCCIHSKSHCY